MVKWDTDVNIFNVGINILRDFFFVCVNLVLRLQQQQTKLYFMGWIDYID